MARGREEGRGGELGAGIQMEKRCGKTGWTGGPLSGTLILFDPPMDGSPDGLGQWGL